MKKIGFFIGDNHFVNHGKKLCDSIINNIIKLKEYEIIAILSDNINFDYKGVKSINIEIKEEFKSIPFLDKIIAAKEFEKRCDEKYMWLDVDSYFLKDVIFENTCEIHVNPVDKKNIGIIYDNELDLLWKTIYEYFEIPNLDRYVYTTIFKEKIYPYYNIGMVVINKNKNLFNEVYKAIIELLKNEDIKMCLKQKYISNIFIHQVIFSCAILKLYKEGISDLPYGVNYPLHLDSDNRNKIPFKDLTSIRYDDYFNNNSIPEQLKKYFDKRLKSKWYY